MRPLERILDLLHVLQNSREPVSFSELRRQFPAYREGSDVATRRKFERDKAELTKLGVVLDYHDGEDGEPEGYTVDTEASYLPPVSLSEAERGTLAMAARAALADVSFPHRASLRLALAKLEAGGDARAPEVHFSHGEPHAPGDDRAQIESLGQALTSRKRVTLAYRKEDGALSEREVEPYGIYLRRGAWYLVAFDHHRESMRVFRVSRILRAKMNPKSPATADFEIPADFSLKQYMKGSPLHYRVHAPVEAEIEVSREVAFLMAKDWGKPDEDGRFRVTTTHLAFLVQQVLSLGPRATLLAPEEGREMMREALRNVITVHEGSP